MVIVAAGAAVVVPVWGATLEPPGWFNAVLLTICAADDPLPVLLGGAALAFLRESSPGRGRHADVCRRPASRS